MVCRVYFAAQTELFGRQAEARAHFEDGQPLFAQTACRGRACRAVSPQAAHRPTVDVGEETDRQEALQACRCGARQQDGAPPALRHRTSPANAPKAMAAICPSEPPLAALAGDGQPSHCCLPGCPSGWSAFESAGFSAHGCCAAPQPRSIAAAAGYSVACGVRTYDRCPFLASTPSVTAARYEAATAVQASLLHRETAAPLAAHLRRTVWT